MKPVDLMRWLVRLVCPPGGFVLDPFAGSGSTGVAALREDRRFLGIERESSYARIARARLAHAEGRTHAKSTSPGLDGQTVDGNPERFLSTAKPSTPLERR